MSEIAVRSELLRLSLLNYENNQELNALYYQVEAIGIGVEYNYDFFKEKLFDVNNIINTITEEITFENLANEEISKILFSINYEKKLDIPYKKELIHDPDIVKLKNQCENLPKEWTVIQLCKEFNPLGYCMTAKDNFEYNCSIYLSLLCYSRWKINNKNPICIRLEKFSLKDGDIHKDITLFLAELSKFSDFSDKLCTQEDKKKYAKFVQSVENSLLDITTRLKKWLGPWICLLIGKPKNRTQIIKENKLYKLVDEFCAIRKFNSRQTVLLSLITRGLYLLNDKNILEASKYLTLKGDEQKLCYNFMLSIKEKVTDDMSYYPSILIIDELLDQFPWEMILPKQEFSRMYSFHLLIKLFEKYKQKIKNGYLYKSINHGNCFINPESNLPSMEKRIVAFFNYWIPNWKCIAGRTLKQPESIDFLTSCDVYVYSGHGSGLQFLKSSTIIEQILECVVFLFGCNSTTMKGYGHNSSMIGTHVYYHIAQCPTIVGLNFIGTDFDVDNVTALIFCDWIPSNSTTTTHFKYINKNAWRKGNIEFNEIETKEKQINNPNLCEIIRNIRLNEQISLKIKSAILLRGLPVWNDNN